MYLHDSCDVMLLTQCQGHTDCYLILNLYMQILSWTEFIHAGTEFIQAALQSVQTIHNQLLTSKKQPLSLYRLYISGY